MNIELGHKKNVVAMSDMIPSVDFHLTHARFWVFYAWPGAVNGNPVFFKDYYVTKFSPDTTTSSIYTIVAPTLTTTHPITTTTTTTTTTCMLKFRFIFNQNISCSLKYGHLIINKIQRLI